MKTTKFDAAEHLDTEEVQAELISEALETGNAKFIAHAIGTVARARGMTQLSKDSGVTRESLYRALSSEGDPRLSTLTSVLSALGIGLKAEIIPAQK